MVAGQLGGDDGNSRQSGRSDNAGANCLFLGIDRRIDQDPHREGYNHQGGVHAEAIGGEGRVSGDVGEDELDKIAEVIICWLFTYASLFVYGCFLICSQGF